MSRPQVADPLDSAASVAVSTTAIPVATVTAREDAPATAPSAPAAYPYRHFGAFRFALAGFVLLQHYAGDLAPEALTRILLPYQFGGMAVLVFFALSGYGIAEVVDRVYQRRARAFLGNRLLRILPHFVLAVALSIGAHALFRLAGGQRLWRLQPSFPADAFDWRNMALNFAQFVPGMDHLLSYNFLDITWTIRVEMLFYGIVVACILVGTRLAGAAGFARALSAAGLALAPLFVLAMLGRAPGMLAFLPHFAFGVSLYYAGRGSRRARWVVAACLPWMLWHAVQWQYVLRPEISAVPGAAMPLIRLNLSIFVAMLALMAWLALNEFGRGRRIDGFLGRITYPLYLYHEVVLIVFLTFSHDYRYGSLAAGIAASLLVAVAMTYLVDPGVERIRDRIRAQARR